MPKVIINPERLTFEDWNTYQNQIQAGEIEDAFVTIRPALVDWDFEVPLEGDRPDLELGFGALPDILWSIRQTIEKAEADLDVSSVDVDLNRVKMGEYYKYLEALRENDTEKIERYYKLVAKINRKGYDDKARLSLLDGLLLKKAVEAQMQHIFRKR